jgi:hypothetical protein
MKAFLYQCEQDPTKEFLGTRAKNADGTFGAYEWLNREQVKTNVHNLARGIMALNLCPEHEAEDKMWRFCGIWARNR